MNGKSRPEALATSYVTLRRFFGHQPRERRLRDPSYQLSRIERLNAKRHAQSDLLDSLWGARKKVPIN